MTKAGDQTRAATNERLLDAHLTLSRPRSSKAKLAQLERMHLRTPRDILMHLPREYEPQPNATRLAEATVGDQITVRGEIGRVSSRWGQRTTRQRARLNETDHNGDRTGEHLELVWFGQPHLERIIERGSIVQVAGKLEEEGRRKSMKGAAWDVIREPGGKRRQAVNTGGLVPKYGLTSGMTQGFMRALIQELLDRYDGDLKRPDPERNRPQLNDLLKAIHRPQTIEAAERARRELQADELLAVHLAVKTKRNEREQATERTGLAIATSAADRVHDSLAFALTKDQKAAIAEIRKELSQDGPAMNRLLLGDVGTGKTIVALTAMIDVATAGGQSVLLAPTEILAEQHYATAKEILNGRPMPQSQGYITQAELPGVRRPLTIGLITGGMSARAKRTVTGQVGLGIVDIAIGTHALIQDQVEIPKLELAIADEQQRFGVKQRQSLRENGHYLMLTATPIPRTTQMSLYGDVNVTELRDRPKSAQKRTTIVLAERQRATAEQAIADAAARGEQSIIVCPLVNSGDEMSGKAAETEHERLQTETLNHLRLGLVHGQMKQELRERTLRKLRDREYDVLVATTVIEVGIDIPNATTMLIESAERFGMAQLHQLRGRIGRGDKPGTCYIMITPGCEPTQETRQRLIAVRDSEDGMYLAERDLDIRGQGDFIGVRQSGADRHLRAGSDYSREDLAAARDRAEQMWTEDEGLKTRRHRLAREARDKMLARMEAG